jgi:hypothetical protein
MEAEKMIVFSPTKAMEAMTANFTSALAVMTLVAKEKSLGKLATTTIRAIDHSVCLAMWEQPTTVRNQNATAAMPRIPSTDSVHGNVIMPPVSGAVSTEHKSVATNRNWSHWESVTKRNNAQMSDQTCVFSLVQVATEMEIHGN